MRRMMRCLSRFTTNIVRCRTFRLLGRCVGWAATTYFGRSIACRLCASRGASRAPASSKARRGAARGRVGAALSFVNDHLIVRPIPAMLEAPQRAQGAALRWPRQGPRGRISPHARAGSDCAQAPIHIHGPWRGDPDSGSHRGGENSDRHLSRHRHSGRQRDLDLCRPRAGRYVGSRRLSLRTGADHARQRYRTYRVRRTFSALASRRFISSPR